MNAKFKIIYNFDKKIFEKCPFKGNSNDSEDKYEGEWTDNERYGYGICYYSEGNYYGEWKNDQKEGIGIITDSDLTRYEWEFSEDNPNDYGIIYHINVQIYKGKLKKGIEMDIT